MAEETVRFRFTGEGRSAESAARSTGRAIGDLGDKAEAANHHFAGLAASLGGKALLGAAAGIAAVGGAVGVVGFKFDNMRQQAQIAFTTMLGSGQKAKAFLDDMQQFAAKTPFDFPGLVKASQRMLAMGFQAQQVKPSLTAIGDAMAGLGQSSDTLQNVTTALGQMQMAGRVTAQDMNQLTAAGVGGWKYLAEASGKSVAEIRKMSEQGMLDGKQAVQTILAGMENDFGGMMEKQSHTFGGLVSTFKDTAQQIAGTIMGPLFGTVTKAMDSLSGKLPAIQQGIADFMAKIGDAQGFSGKLGVVFDGLSSFADKAFDALKAGIARIDWGSVWNVVASGLQKFPTLVLDLIGLAQGIHKKLTDAFSSIPWGTVWDTVVSTLSKVPEIASRLASGLVRSAEDTFAALKRAFDAVPWASLWNVVTTALGKVPPLVAEVATGATTIATGILDSLIKAVEQTPWAKLGTSVSTSVTKALSNLSTSISNMDWNEVGQSLVKGMGLAIEALANFLLHVDWVGVVKGLAALDIAIVKAFVGLDVGILKGISGIGDKVEAKLEAELGRAFRAIGGFIRDRFEGVWDGLEKAADKAVLAIIEPFTHLPKRLGGGPFQEMKTELEGKLNSMDEPAATAGQRIGKALGGNLLSSLAPYLQQATAAMQKSMNFAGATPGAANILAAGLPTGSVTRGVGGVTAAQLNAAAQKAGVPPALLAALIQQESGGSMMAASGAGAIGYGQLVPDTPGGKYKTIGGKKYNIYDPAQNLAGAAAYLAGGLTSYGGDPTKALENYYGGGGGVRNPNEKVPGGPTPSQYAAQVLGRVTTFPTSGTSTTPGSGKSSVKWQGDYGGLKGDFKAKLESAVASLGGGTIVVNSGRRSKDHNAEVGGASNSNHLTGSAADGKVVLADGRSYDLGMLPINYSAFGLRSGATFNWGGAPDIVHVDDGSNVGGVEPTGPGTSKPATPTFEQGNLVTPGQGKPKAPPITAMTAAVSAATRTAAKTPTQDDDVLALEAYRKVLQARADVAGRAEKDQVALNAKIAALTKTINAQTFTPAEVASTGIGKKLTSLLPDISDVDTAKLRHHLQDLAKGIHEDLTGLVTALDVKDAKAKLTELKEGLKGAGVYDAISGGFKAVQTQFQTLAKEGVWTPEASKGIQGSFDKLKADMAYAMKDGLIDKDEAKKLKDEWKALTKAVGEGAQEFKKGMDEQAKIIETSRKVLQDAVSSVANIAGDLGGRLQAAFKFAADKVGVAVGGFISPEQVAKAEQAAEKLRQMLTHFMPEAQRKAVEAQLAALGETIKTGFAEAVQGAADATSDFRTKWDAFKSGLLDAFKEKVVLKFQATIDFAQQYEQQERAAIEGKKLGDAYANAVSGSLTDGEARVQASVERLRAAQAAYAAAVISQDRDRIKAAVDELIAAQDQMAGIETAGLSEREKAILDAGQALAAAERTAGDARIQAAKARWETITNDALVEVGNQIDAIRTKLEAGSITMGDALAQIAGVLRDHGMDASDALQLVSDSAGGAMGALVTAVEGAFTKLESAIDRLIATLNAAAPGAAAAAGNIATGVSVAFGGMVAASEQAVGRMIELMNQAASISGTAPPTAEETQAIGNLSVEQLKQLYESQKYGFAGGGSLDYVGGARRGMRVPGIRGPVDNVIAKVSPGELIMTVAQQTQLAKSLVGGGPQPIVQVAPGWYNEDDVVNAIARALSAGGRRTGADPLNWRRNA